MDKLNLEDEFREDESIEKYELHEYEPNKTNLNNDGEIRFIIQNQDVFLDISKSYLVFEGQLVRTKPDTIEPKDEYKDTDKITLCNNGLMFLFEQISYSLSGKDIETIRYPGEATTMMGLLKYSRDFEGSKGLNQLWYREGSHIFKKNGFEMRQNYIIYKPTKKGTFSFSVPLKHIFGFCDSYDKVIYGFTHKLTLVRKSSDNDAIINNGQNLDDGKIRLDKLSWYVPHVEPNLENKKTLMKKIENRIKYKVGYKMIQCDNIDVPQAKTFNWRLAVKSSPEKPRFIVIGFQTDRDNKQNMDKAVFDHCNVKNIYAQLNSRRYPEVDYNLNFLNRQFSRVFLEAVEFKEKYYNLNPLVSSVNMTSFDYEEYYPIFVIDVSNQSDAIKEGLTDIKVKVVFNESVPANTEAYGVIISDRIITFEADGSKMSVIQ